MKELIKKVYRYEIEIRKALTTRLQGDFRSLFKGTGIEFDDVRSYQYGDDVRAIHWGSSAKGHGTYVKTFKEEKEQTVYMIVDVSASQNIGQSSCRKVDQAKEIASVLSLAALREQSHVGIMAFSDQEELYIPPTKGMAQATRIVKNLFDLKPSSLQTNIADAFRFALHRIRRKSVLIFISDFIDTGYDSLLKAVARKHDLILIHMVDSQEMSIPALGTVPLYDEESGKVHWVNTSARSFQKESGRRFHDRQNKLQSYARKAHANYVCIQTNTYYVPQLIRLFSLRNQQRKTT